MFNKKYFPGISENNSKVKLYINLSFYKIKGSHNHASGIAEISV